LLEVKGNGSLQTGEPVFEPILKVILLIPPVLAGYQDAIEDGILAS
jgi:hypothetical protein